MADDDGSGEGDDGDEVDGADGVEQDRVIRPATVEVATSGLATNPVVKRER